MVNIGIVGGTGYTGVELLRLLAFHDAVQVSLISSRSEAGRSVTELYPSLRGFYDDLQFSNPSVEEVAACDLVFFATPHGVAQSMMKTLIDRGVRVVDLSADFRLQDIQLWESWYDQKHACGELAASAVYGLPEVNREKIKAAQLVACPGCYPTAIQLGFLPLIEAGLVDTSQLIASAASGVSGAGRQAKVANLFTEASESFKAYGVTGHRHLPEIEQELSRAAQSGDASSLKLTFVPHLMPAIRGIHATLFASPKVGSDALSEDDLRDVFAERYKNEPFVDTLPKGHYPLTGSVLGSNFCRIAVYRPLDRDKIVVLSVIDNLAKGSSGQAIQNMNIMLGFAESKGLNVPPLSP